MLLNLRTVVTSTGQGNYLRLDQVSLQSAYGVKELEARLSQIRDRSEEELLKMIAEVDEAIRLNTV